MPPSLATAFARAIELYSAGEPLAASILFAAVLTHVPEHADTLRLRGLALVRAGKAEEALDPLRKARRLAPRNPLSHLHYGIGLQDCGRFARAAACFRRASILLPSSEAPWINLSAALLSLNHVKAARAAARRAVALAPDAAEPLNALALAEMTAGDVDAAKLAFAEAIRRRRTFADAWTNLVLLLIRTGEIQQAHQAITKGLEACPAAVGLEAARAGLAIIGGEQDEAVAHLKSIIERDPTCVAARLNLANALLLEDAPQAALTTLAGAVPKGREGAHWRAHRSLCLINLGRKREAEAELDAIWEPYGDAEILILWRRIHLAREAGQREAAEEMATRMEALARTEGAALFEHRIIAHFDLARFHASVGRDDRAFQFWIDGHRLIGRIQPFSREHFSAFVDANIDTYSQERMCTGPRSANTDAAPVFIVGTPRSGTTLTEQILAAHPHVHGAGERGAIHTLFRRLAGPAIRASSVHAAATIESERLDREANTFLAELHELAPAKRLIADKMPANALHLGFIATLLPGAKIIHCIRDPRDMGLSIFQHRFFGYHPYAHDLGDLGWYLGAHERLMTHWKAVLPRPIFEVRLTDWVEAFDATLDRLLAFLDLPYDAACARFHEQDRPVRTASAAQVRQPINARGVGRWKRHAAALAPLLSELEAAGLLEHGPEAAAS